MNKLLHNGQSIPPIGMGTFGSDHADAATVKNAVSYAIQCGYRLFDCASVYGNEAQIGEIFHEAINSGDVNRNDLFIISKVWNDRHNPGDVLVSLAQTLKDLRLDFLDCYFVHWPFPNYHAPGCDGDARNPDARPFILDEFISVWKQMERVCKMGLTKSIGMSNMTRAKLKQALPLCEIKPTLLEMELHPSFQQPDLFEYCIQQNIQPIGYSPLGSPNRHERDKTDGDVIDTQMPEVIEIAERRNIHPANVCLKWAVQRGQIPIPFSTSQKNIASNLECISSDLLSDDEMNTLSKADKNCRLVKGQVFLWQGAKGWEDLWD